LGWIHDRCALRSATTTLLLGYVVSFFQPRHFICRVLILILCRDYTTKVFGFATFGRVYGAIICLSGIANFSQYGLDALTHRTFDGNPIPINAALAVAGFIVGMLLVIFVFVSVRKLREQGQADDDERERLLLEEDEYEDESDEDTYR
jgi:uncharacterized membrane protein